MQPNGVKAVFIDMDELLQHYATATKVVHWPTGLTYACDYHAGALRKIASSMGIHVSIEDHPSGLRQCTNCVNENSIARGDGEMEKLVTRPTVETSI